MKNKFKVFVGLSGGVDSAVSAALLKKQDYDVTGVFIKAWQPFDSAQGTRRFPCGWKEDRRSAMRVAAVLDIPFLTLDLEKEYKKKVVDYMITEYKAGRTPNPDVMCNKEIKFGHFLKFALKNGADFIATGHYAIKNELRMMNYELCEGRDKNKDQSYFLWTLTQDQLKHILFPIGNLQKQEVRRLAKKFGLPQATRKDSQGLCFLGKINVKEFLSHYIPQRRGEVLNENGEVIGHHNGALFFTIGERHGFNVIKKSNEEKPLYVISKDIKNNTITVASKITPHKKSQRASLTLRGVNIINELPNNNLTCRIRYRGEKIPCQLNKNKVTLSKLQTDISAGQSLVIYLPVPRLRGQEAGQDEICLGGGIIQ